jgi:hypothetical protein
MQRHIFSLALLISLLAFGSTVAVAEGKKNGFVDTTTTSQGSSGKPCNSPNGCTTTTTSQNKGGNNPQPPTCTTNVDSKCN